MIAPRFEELKSAILRSNLIKIQIGNNKLPNQCKFHLNVSLETLQRFNKELLHYIKYVSI